MLGRRKAEVVRHRKKRHRKKKDECTMLTEGTATWQMVNKKYRLI